MQMQLINQIMWFLLVFAVYVQTKGNALTNNQLLSQINDIIPNITF